MFEQCLHFLENFAQRSLKLQKHSKIIQAVLYLLKSINKIYKDACLASLRSREF